MNPLLSIERVCWKKSKGNLPHNASDAKIQNEVDMRLHPQEAA